MQMKRVATVALVAIVSTTQFLCAQTAKPPSPAVAAPGSVMAQALMLQGTMAEWHTTADGHDIKLLRSSVESMMKSHPPSTDEALAYAPALITLYRVYQGAALWTSVTALHDALLARLKNGATLSPEERYYAAVFLAEYSATVHEDFAAVEEIVLPGATLDTAKSIAVRTDASAWQLAALVDTLEWLPADAPQYAALLPELQSVAAGAAKAPADAGGAVAARLRSYAFLKAIRLGWLPQSAESAAVKAATAMHEQPAVDTKGQNIREAGAAMLLSSELDQVSTEAKAQGKMVVMDGWFNSQKRKDPKGNEELFHYKWNVDDNSGFSFFGRAFQRYGAKLSVLAEEPTLATLNDASVYLIVSPDIPAKNPKPNYVNKQDVEAITTWVSNGGVLVLMMNDNTNTEFEHLNTLSERFGIHFNAVLKNTVEGMKYEQGKVVITGNTGVFAGPHTAYMKEICTISTQEPAKPVLRDQLHDSGDVYMAVATYGKGTVYAVVDPWLYNEYVDGRKLPAEFDQYASAKDLAGWLLGQAK